MAAMKAIAGEPAAQRRGVRRIAGMFWTALNELKSPENAGMIVRSHVAFGGEELVVIGTEPWQFKKRAQSFSRRLEHLCAFKISQG
jgi:hypothetical protein